MKMRVNRPFRAPSLRKNFPQGCPPGLTTRWGFFMLVSALVPGTFIPVGTQAYMMKHVPMRDGQGRPQGLSQDEALTQVTRSVLAKCPGQIEVRVYNPFVDESQAELRMDNGHLYVKVDPSGTPQKP